MITRLLFGDTWATNMNTECKGFHSSTPSWSQGCCLETPELQIWIQNVRASIPPSPHDHEAVVWGELQIWIQNVRVWVWWSISDVGGLWRSLIACTYFKCLSTTYFTSKDYTIIKIFNLIGQCGRYKPVRASIPPPPHDHEAVVWRHLSYKYEYTR